MPLACRRTELSIVFERNHAATPLSCYVAATLTTPEYETANATRIIRTMAARKPDASLMTDLLLASGVSLAVPLKPAESVYASAGRWTGLLAKKAARLPTSYSETGKHMGNLKAGS